MDNSHACMHACELVVSSKHENTHTQRLVYLLMHLLNNPCMQTCMHVGGRRIVRLGLFMGLFLSRRQAGWARERGKERD